MSLLMIRNYETVNELSRQGKSPVSIVTPGAPGKAGESAYEIAVRNGYKGSETEWLATFNGQPGVNGLSAYQVAVQNGYNGSEGDWLASLIGPRGISAYQVATASGFAGTQGEWLVSLVGLKGDTGEIGPIGPTGAVGSQGPQGESGMNGTNGRTPELSCVDNGAIGSTIRWKYTDETGESAWRPLYTVSLATCS